MRERLHMEKRAETVGHMVHNKKCRSEVKKKHRRSDGAPRRTALKSMPRRAKSRLVGMCIKDASHVLRITPKNARHAHVDARKRQYLGARCQYTP